MKSALKMLLALLLLACGNALSAPSAPEPSLQTLPLSELEQRLESIDTELSNLANSSLRNGVGNLGWISNLREGDPGMEWAQVELINIVSFWFQTRKGNVNPLFFSTLRMKTPTIG